MNTVARIAVVSVTYGISLGASLAMADEASKPPSGGDAPRTERKWDWTLGAGLAVAPEYRGAEDHDVVPVPLIRLEWNERFFISTTDGIGARLALGRDTDAIGSIGYDQGRDQDDADRLNGLGDIDAAATLNLRLQHRLGLLSPYIEVERHLGGTDGLLANLGVQATLPLGGLSYEDGKRSSTRQPMLSLGLSTQWADDQYMEDYFGVSASQSGRSGLAQYSAGSGFNSISADINLSYPFAERWAVNTRVGYSHLVGDAADSPIVSEESQVSGGVFLTYRF